MGIGYRDHRRVVELDAPLATVVIGQIVKGDDNADRIVVALTHGGKPADLTGYSADGLFFNALGQPVPLTATVSGSEIRMVLSGGCYDVSGSAAGHVRLIGSGAGQIRTVLRFVADVLSDGSGDPYDPDKVIGDVETLLAKLTAMENATADGLAAAQEARSAGAQAIADANAAGDAAKATAQAAADDATAAAETARATIYTRAVAIPDESALAASHELHVQRDYPLNVAVHGYTYQEGEGDPSPDNVRPIHGVDDAWIHAGSKNLWAFGDLTFTQEKYIDFKPYLPACDMAISALVTSADAVGDCQIAVFDENLKVMASKYFPPNSGNRIARTLSFEAPIRRMIFRSDTSYGDASGKVSEWKDVQIEVGSTATPYEPYLANVITPPLLPDNSPLMEGDVVENWVRSGCDKCVTFDGSADENIAPDVTAVSGTYRFAIGKTDIVMPEYISGAAVHHLFSNYLVSRALDSSGTYGGKEGISAGYIAEKPFYVVINGVSTPEELRNHLAANPLTVYYRSTDYTPEKDLKVCRVGRNKKLVEYDGSADEKWEFGYYGHGEVSIPAQGLLGNNQIKSETLKLISGAAAATGFFTTNGRIAIKSPSCTSLAEYKELIAGWASEGKPATFLYQLDTPEIYMTDPLPLLPPAALASETVTVTGSGETEVTYAHETKHYIDSQIAAAVALALNG